jgi:two-component system, OmpR family, copper resistance phosphate regulon response regulator CusR
MRVLLIEDEKKAGAFLRKGLEENGFTVDLATNGEQGLAAALSEAYDLLIVDVLLPEKDGWQVVSEFRKQNKNTPILFLTARDSVRDRVKGFDLGADDYLVKPFAFAELLARLRSLLRRSPSPQQDHFGLEDLEIDLRRNRATRAGIPLNLTAKEFLILAQLARAGGEVVSRADILDQVWDVKFETTTNIVDVMVRRLRAKVDDPFDNKLVRTIRGVGYALKSD